MPPTENSVTTSHIAQCTAFRRVITRTAEPSVAADRIKKVIFWRGMVQLVSSSVPQSVTCQFSVGSRCPWSVVVAPSRGLCFPTCHLPLATCHLLHPLHFTLRPYRPIHAADACG